jgi:uncharacterized protein
VDLEAFELVLLRRPESLPDYEDAELDRIQSEHLDHHRRLRESGQVVTNGPVRQQPDESLRGLTFYRTGSLEEARRLAEADPAVQAGRLVIEIMTWYCPPGTMTKPGRSVSLLAARSGIARGRPLGTEASGRQPDWIALGVTHANQPVSLVCALLLGIKLHALITKTAHHVVEVVNRETWCPPRARTIADPVGMVGCQR